jgi:hypothetical protein
MCTKAPKEVKVAEEKGPGFAIRDILPEDLLVLPTEKKPASPVDPKMDLTSFLANGTDGAAVAKVSLAGPHEVTILPKPTSKRIRRKYFPEPEHGSQVHGNTEKDTQETHIGVTASESILVERNGSQAQDKFPKYILPHKLRPSAVTTPAFFDDFPPLPPTKPVPPIPSGDRKRKNKAKETTEISPVSDQFIAETFRDVEMDSAVGQGQTISHSMKTNVSALEELADAFLEKTLVDYSEKEHEKLLTEGAKNGHTRSGHCQADEIDSSVYIGLGMQQYL